MTYLQFTFKILFYKYISWRLCYAQIRDLEKRLLSVVISILIQLNSFPEDIWYPIYFLMTNWKWLFFLNGSIASNIQREVYNINWVSLSYILISGENSGKAVEDKVRHSCTLHIYLLKKSRPQKISNTKITRESMMKNNNSHKELTQYLKIKERSAKPVNCATFDW